MLWPESEEATEPAADRGKHAAHIQTTENRRKHSEKGVWWGVVGKIMLILLSKENGRVYIPVQKKEALGLKEF